MFVRRLLLVGGAIGVGLAVLGAQTWRLTVVQGAEHLGAAERRMVAERWTPTVRGRVLDRKGRVLALDEPAFDVMVDYDVITGDWAYSTAASKARTENRERWGELDRSGRERLIADYLPEAEESLGALWAELAYAVGVGREALEERRHAIVAQVERMANAIWDARLERRRADLNRDRELTVEVSREEVSQPIREQRMPHAVVTGIDEEAAFRVRRVAERRAGVSLATGSLRTYPFERVTVEVDRSTFPPPIRSEGLESVTVDGVGTHVVGWMRPTFAEDVARRPRRDSSTGEVDPGHYRTGDLAGRNGVEGSYEDVLRGLRGYVVKHRESGIEEITEPTPGQDVRLTIDVMLQARVQAALEPEVGLARVQDWHATKNGLPMPIGTPLNGAAVVIDVDTGEVLAMVSSPTFTREQLRTAQSWVYEDPIDQPWVDRTIARPYMPGSPIKPLILAAAVTEGVHRLGEVIECTGHLIPTNDKRFRCWVFKDYGTTHNEWFGHDLDGDEAICASCNIYFYTLGRLLGVDGMREWLGRFGVGRSFGLGVGPEYLGVAGIKESGEATFLGDAILMGIGQGPVAWTPMHAADVYATLARGGQRILPRVVRGERPVAEDLLLDPEAVDTALEGLWRAVNDDMGTGHSILYPSGVREPIFDIPGVSIWGKTGTATSPPILGDEYSEKDAEGEMRIRREVLRKGDHSWFVLLAGREGETPRYAVAVIVEYAGSGGRVAGPIAEQVVLALKAEGYL